MIPYVTFKYSSILGIVYFLLSSWVIVYRVKYRVFIGHNSIQDLEKIIRTHANFSEYIPICLILLAGFELLFKNVNQTHVLGILLVAGRVLHIFGVNYRSAPNTYRILGMVFTFIVMLYSSVVILYSL